MTYERILDGLKRFGATERDICIQGTGVLPEQIREKVVIAPWWEPSVLPGLGTAAFLSRSASDAVKVWDVQSDGAAFTYIKTGIGAPVLMDVILSLGVTSCRKILFIGSAGSLDETIGIGDVVLPAYSVCGDGASRYLASDRLEHDCWGERVYPNPELFAAVRRAVDGVCEAHGVKWHTGRNFSIDTITAQFAHIDTILALRCNVIEMETAAAFRAAKLAGIAIAAVFNVSDNTVVHKSLVSGRTDEELRYRKYVRAEVFPRVVKKVFS